MYDFPTFDTKGNPTGRFIRIHADREGRPFIYMDGLKFTLVSPETAFEIADALVDLAESIERG